MLEMLIMCCLCQCVCAVRVGVPPDSSESPLPVYLCFTLMLGSEGCLRIFFLLFILRTICCTEATTLMLGSAEYIVIHSSVQSILFLCVLT